jgi:hypothetical protein
MWDGREPSLFSQAVDATLGHAQGLAAPTAKQQQQIVSFEGCTAANTPALCVNTPAGAGVFTAQISHAAASVRSTMPVDMWTIGFADRLRFPRFPSQLEKRANARLRPHPHRAQPPTQGLIKRVLTVE